MKECNRGFINRQMAEQLVLSKIEIVIILDDDDDDDGGSWCVTFLFILQLFRCMLEKIDSYISTIVVLDTGRRG